MGKDRFVWQLKQILQKDSRYGEYARSGVNHPAIRLKPVSWKLNLNYSEQRSILKITVSSELHCPFTNRQKILPAQSTSMEDRDQCDENPRSDPDNTGKIDHENPMLQERRTISLPAKSSMKKSRHLTKTGESNRDRHVQFELSVDMHRESTSYTRKFLKSVSKFLMRVSVTASLISKMVKSSRAINMPEPIS